MGYSHEQGNVGFFRRRCDGLASVGSSGNEPGRLFQVQEPPSPLWPADSQTAIAPFNFGLYGLPLNI